MGMYTEIYIKLTLKRGIPQHVINTLKVMIGEEETLEGGLPEHSLFQSCRWLFMLRSSSYYHIPESFSHLWWDDIADQWFLISRSDFKNYDSEAEKFFDWIEPYAEKSGIGKTFVGYTLYEESREPTLIYFGEGEKTWRCRLLESAE